MGRMEWSEGGKWDKCNSIINKLYLKIKYLLMKKRKSEIKRQEEKEELHDSFTSNRNDLSLNKVRKGTTKRGKGIHII